MLFHDRFKLPGRYHSNVDSAWFEHQKQQSAQSNDPNLHDWLVTEVEALKARRPTNAEKAASLMTNPLSTSPAPALGGWPDDVLSLGNLWRVITAALIEWPTTCATEIFTPLSAIAKAPGYIHKGEAVDDEGGKLTWAHFPYFGLGWHKSTGAGIQPGQICRQYSDLITCESARKLCLKMKDVEAQLAAKHVLKISKAMIQLIIRALEEEIGQSDEQLAPDEATAYNHVKLDLDIPVISLMFKYNGHELFDQVVTKGLGDWTMHQSPGGARECRNAAERWSFWKERLKELSQGDDGDQVRDAAGASLEYMSWGV